MRKRTIKIISIFFFLFVLIFLYLKFFKKKEIATLSFPSSEQPTYTSNIIDNVYYNSKDVKGNEYIIKAVRGEIDFENSNIIYLTDVTAFVKLNTSKNIIITSDFGKYNINNYDTIFSKNVISNYLENKITGEYLDFSIQRNSMIVSRNVVYTNFENILTADVMEVDIKTKDTKIFMYENNKKVNIKSKN